MDAETKEYWRIAFGLNAVPPAPKLNWPAEIEKEKALRDTVLKSEGGPPKKMREALQDWYRQVSFMLHTCNQHSKLAHLELTPPVEMFAALSGLADYLSRGVIPDPISAVTKPGNPPVRPGEEAGIAWACAYINGSKIGAIKDRSYIKTVCEAYGVKRQAAQKWAKGRFPERLAMFPISAGMVERRMRESAQRYSRFGRSISGLSYRAKHQQ